MSAPLLEVRGLRIGFGGNPPVIDGLDLCIGSAERLGLIGASGAGKSLVARALIGLLPVGARALGGELRWRGEPVAGGSLRGRRIAYVFQDAASSLHPLRRIGAQLDECLRVHAPRLDRAARAARIRAALAELGFDADPRWLRAFPHALSGGQRQRLMLALALLPEPELVLADEPTSALDPLLARRVCELLVQAAQRRGMGLLLISHERARVAEYCPRVLELRGGKAVAWPGGVAAPAPFTSLAAVADPGLAIEAERLVLAWDNGPRWPGQVAPPAQIDGVTLRLARGGRLGIVGGSGSGKSTLARGLLGLLAPRSGVVRWFGQPLAAFEPAELRALRPRVQMVFQDPYRSLDPLQRIDAMLDEALRRAAPARPAADRRAAAGRLLAAVGLQADALLRWPSQFSGGQRQRLAIARALASEPDVLICDEATSALDHDVRDQILDLLDGLARSRGLALLFIAHDLEAVARLCDHLLVIEDGRVVEQGASADLLAHPASAALRALVDALPRRNPAQFQAGGRCQPGSGAESPANGSMA